MAIIHFILQGKGGVGKSVVATLFYQFLQAYNFEVSAFDADPVNATLSGYKEFKVDYLSLLSNDGDIDSRKFDFLLDRLADASLDQHIIVDNGASSFIAMGAYMKAVEMLDTLEGLGHHIYFHTVITGGQALDDTIGGFIRLASNFPTAKLVVWLNYFFGAIEQEGKHFKEFNCYEKFHKNIVALIELPQGNQELIGKDLTQVFTKKESLKTAISNSKHIAIRSRLSKFQKQIFQRIEDTGLFLQKDTSEIIGDN